MERNIKIQVQANKQIYKIEVQPKIPKQICRCQRKVMEETNVGINRRRSLKF